jgi:hypothetical protein
MNTKEHQTRETLLREAYNKLYMARNDKEREEELLIEGTDRLRKAELNIKKWEKIIEENT